MGNIENTENNENKVNKDRSPRQGGTSWMKPFLIFYAKTTSWIIFPLILGLLGGKYVSKSFGSQGLFFVFLMAGFLISCYGIYREIKKYKKDLEK